MSITFYIFLQMTFRTNFNLPIAYPHTRVFPSRPNDQHFDECYLLHCRIDSVDRKEPLSISRNSMTCERTAGMLFRQCALVGIAARVDV